MTAAPQEKILAYDALALSEPDHDRATHYAEGHGCTCRRAYWSVLYPATIARIREVLDAGDALAPNRGGHRGVPSELIDAAHRETEGVHPLAAARRLRRACRLLPASAWDHALLPRHEIPGADQFPRTPNVSPDELLTIVRRSPTSPAADLLIRAAALEYARLWFTRALKQQIPAGLHLRLIPDDLGFRL